MGKTPAPAVRVWIRPMVTNPAEGGGSFTLDTFVPSLLNLRAGEVAGIIGGARSGRTTALEMLNGTLPRTTTRIDDATEKRLVVHRTSGAPVVYTADAPLAVRHACVLYLQPWGEDQWIEYLLANHRGQCAGVMARVRTARWCDRLNGNPELWAIALDMMAADDSVKSPVLALHAALRDKARRAALRSGHRVCEAMWISSRIAGKLRAGKDHDLPVQPDAHLIDELAALTDDRVAASLVKVANDGESTRQGAALAVLGRAGRAWRPPTNARIVVRQAHLEGMDWSRSTISRLVGTNSSLPGLSLRHSRVMECSLIQADLRYADLAGAFLTSPILSHAVLDGADLTKATLSSARLSHATLARVNAEGAGLAHAECRRTDFSGARLVRADLSHADLDSAVFAEADLSGACLDGAAIAGVDFRRTLLHGVRMGGTLVERCTFDAVEAEALDANHALFSGCDLSATVLRNARFEHARLHGCGLADIDWESANLREADLTGCTFHAGSSRSGLVSSPIASEGSRTGFYTDDFDDRTHKAPEEIRKANLCFADLRGCRCERVDFYLVDLRRALYTPDQAQWFRKCGAILRNFA